ncbi:hypothetical protein ACOSP7_025537 [Xanthoceras sorbifolium]
MGDKIRESCSNPSPLRKWWLLLWNLNIPPKVKIFVWRVFHNYLPSLLNLFRRKVTGDPTCPRCREAAEFAEHALFWCKEVEPVWEKSVFGFWDKLKGLSSSDLLCCVALNISREDLALVCMVCWGIWSQRNHFVHGSKSQLGRDVLSWVAGLLLEFHNTKLLFKCSSAASPPSAGFSWLPPSPGCVKLNIDAAVVPGADFFGVGAVFRDSNGKVLVSLSKPLRGCVSAELGEFLALREGLLLTRFFGFFGYWVEVDVSNVASAVQLSLPSLGVAGLVLNDILSLVSEVQVCKCLAISRSGNSLAHDLASAAFSSNREVLW